jgi:hypothetical protein
MVSLNETSKDSASQSSITDIRNKLDDIHALLFYFKKTFDRNEYDSILKQKQALLAKELLEELNENGYSKLELVERLATALTEREKSAFNLGRLELFQNEIVKRVADLREFAAGRTRKGRDVDELMYEFSRLTVKNYRLTHDGKYPSANYLATKVSDEAKSVFNNLKEDFDSLEGPREFKAWLLEKLTVKDSKLAEKGTDFLSTRTANSYLNRIKSEDDEKIGNS